MVGVFLSCGSSRHWSYLMSCMQKEVVTCHQDCSKTTGLVCVMACEMKLSNVLAVIDNKPHSAASKLFTTVSVSTSAR